MMTRTEKDKMLAGELYNADAPELQAEMAITYRWLARYNAALGASASDLRVLLLERLGAVGEGAMIRPPFHCDYGFNISLGAGVFLVTRRRSGQGFRSSPPITHAMRLKGPAGWNLVARSASGVASGSEAAQLSCRA
jgi:hypothetical protein